MRVLDQLPSGSPCLPLGLLLAFLYCFDAINRNPPSPPHLPGAWLGFERGRGRSAGSQIPPQGASAGDLREFPLPVLGSFKTEHLHCFFLGGHTSLLGNVVALFISHILMGLSWQNSIFSLAFQCIGFMECSFQCQSSPLLLPAVMWAGVEGQLWGFYEARGCSLK